MHDERNSYIALNDAGSNEAPHSWSLKISGATIFSSVGFVTEEGVRNCIKKTQELSRERSKFIIVDNTFEFHDEDSSVLGKSIQFTSADEMEKAIHVFHGQMQSSSIISSNDSDEEKHHTFTIFISGEEHQWNKKTISFEEVVIEFFGSYDNNPQISYTVEYKYKKTDGQYTSMAAGDVVEVKNKMRFEVDKTDRS